MKKATMQMKKVLFLLVMLSGCLSLPAQINTDRVLAVGRNALYFEDYVLSIQYFNQVIRSKPWLAEPYFYRAVAKINLDDFQGAEEDCSLCIARNPFLVQAYYARGIARQSQEKYNDAIGDYEKGLGYRPEDRQMLVNMAVAYIQKKDYGGAEKTFEELLKAHPHHAVNYLTRGAMYIEKGDTVQALADYDQAVSLDPYYAPSYGNRAILRYQQNDLQGALGDLNEAIHLDTRQNGYYINRGLVRYQMNDLRGAMADYDQVINMDSRNLIARFNRGLLRFQVGDNNRAIEDFDLVIGQDPDNYPARYNRALLRYETGNYLGAIDDYDTVLNEYPNFLPAYYSRAEAKRKVNDPAGADKDYLLAYEKEEQLRKDRAAGKTSDPTDAAAEDNTREQSDKNIGKFNRLVVYDKDEERRNKYQSDIRGRVQDRDVRVDLEPQFILTYYEKPDPVKKIIYYDKSVEAFNNRMLLPMKLLLTNQEAALNEGQIATHFASIDRHSSLIEQHPDNATAHFARAVDYMLVQDFQEAIKNYDQAIALAPSFAPAYFNRAAVRYKQLEYTLSQASAAVEDFSSGMTLSIGGKKSNAAAANAATDLPSAQLRENKRSYEHEMIVRDYDILIQLNPDFVYAYFNRGNLRCAQRDFRAAALDYTAAIERDPDFAEAYFNRGLARLSQGDANRGIADLSKAGELGIINAYSIIKRMTSGN
ncbi:lipoprotein NlpI [Bacteroidales bacterium Barb4]|nr:lipoprotein NlpI [Bacteroidales bacterium Barb4]